MSKRLYRSRTNIIISGVSAGMADFFGIDVSVVRLLWVFAGLMGPGIVAYLIAWAIIPQEPALPDYLDTEQVGDTWQAVETEDSDSATSAADRQRTAAIILIGIGLVFLARRVIPNFIFSWTWPIVLIAFGSYILYQDRRGK